MLSKHINIVGLKHGIESNSTINKLYIFHVKFWHKLDIMIAKNSNK